MLYGFSIAIALILLYKFLPNKKIFPYFCVALLLVFGVSAFLQNRNTTEKLTRAQIEELQFRQKIFGDWYADYQKNINRLDLNWQRYFSIVNELKTAEVYEYKTYEQLIDLEQASLDEKKIIDELKVPSELDEISKKLLDSIIKKTKSYAAAQAKTISLTRQTANPAIVTNINEMNKKINEINIRESPTGLFTASEISAIREILDDKD